MDVVDDTTGATARLAWAECERRLYPLATSAPARYEQAVRVVRAVADDLRSIGTSDELLDRWRGASALVVTVASERDLPVADVPVEHIAGAAFSLRHGELVAAEQHRARQARVAAARAAGAAWVTLEERGDIEAGLLDTYQAIEMHLGTGLAIVTTVEADPGSGAPTYVLAVAALEPATGELVDADPGFADWTVHREVEELRTARRALVELVESHDGDA